MTKETKMRILRVYSILLGVVIVIAALCLMAGCLSIYNSGHQPYSPEIVAQTFSKISIPVFLCIGMIILGFVLNFLLSPVDEKKEKKVANITKELSEADILEAKRIKVTRYCILGVAILFLVYGLATGGIADVLAKAINICTECIGLG
jgi:formate-dependent nitrite reductase membrane component NrfD